MCKSIIENMHFSRHHLGTTIYYRRNIILVINVNLFFLYIFLFYLFIIYYPCYPRHLFVKHHTARIYIPLLYSCLLIDNLSIFLLILTKIQFRIVGNFRRKTLLRQIRTPIYQQAITQDCNPLHLTKLYIMKHHIEPYYVEFYSSSIYNTRYTLVGLQVESCLMDQSYTLSNGKSLGKLLKFLFICVIHLDLL